MFSLKVNFFDDSLLCTKLRTIGYTCTRARHASRGVNKLNFTLEFTICLAQKIGRAFLSVVRATPLISLSMRDQRCVRVATATK